MHNRGFSLVEVMVVIAIAATLLAIAVPQFQDMITGARVRTVAESIQSGLVYARSEAIKRNAPMRFQMVTSLDNTCAYSSTANFWVVTQYVDANSRGLAAGKCASTPAMPEDQGEPCAGKLVGDPCFSDPFIAYKSSSQVISNVTVAAVAGTTALSIVTFGPLGQILPSMVGGVVVPSPTTSVAYAVQISPASGSSRSYRVQINANGGIKVCNPNATDSSACPS